MSKFKQNQKLKEALNSIPPKENIVAANNVPAPNTVNRQGYAAYSLADELRLLSMLNTLKLEPQYYRSESETMKELRDLIERIAIKDPYFVAQSIVYSRCVGEGMRSINHLAAALLAPFVSGQEWGRRFYSLWNKKEQKGGCIFRPDDMSEITNVFSALNKTKLTNAMKKGFANALERLDTYSILKYKKPLYDVINLSHPNSANAIAEVTVDGNVVKALDAIKQGLSVAAETWEVAQTEAGQIVAEAVKEGKITKEKAEQVLKEAKSENWNQLLSENKLGILAALRNIRNILTTGADVDALCKLLENPTLILQGKIMPYQIDMARTIISSEFTDADSRKVLQSLVKGYELAVPNLKEILTGKTLVIVDMSGSMWTGINFNKKAISSGGYWGSRSLFASDYVNTCANKAATISATIAKATNADIIRFGSSAEYVSWNPNQDVFTIAQGMWKDMGGTNLSTAWRLAAQAGKVYDRVFILSDNECNRGSSYDYYKEYVRKCGDPYVYSVDMAAYGTTAIVGPKVRYYYGYGMSMFEDIANVEFNPNQHIEKVRKIVI